MNATSKTTRLSLSESLRLFGWLREMNHRSCEWMLSFERMKEVANRTFINPRKMVCETRNKMTAYIDVRKTKHLYTCSSYTSVREAKTFQMRKTR